MRSTPLICSSIGIATVSAITFGLAPGNCALTITDGGTTSGYSEIGITGSASNPATKIRTERTPAKIGRSMKNLDRFMALVPRILCNVGASLRLAVHADKTRRDNRARAHALQPVHDDPLARLKPPRAPPPAHH